MGTRATTPPRTRARRAEGRVLGALPAPVRRTIAGLRGRDVRLFASSLAFYALISLPPLLIVAMWVAGLVLGDQQVQRLASALDGGLPERLGAGDALLSIAREGTTLGLASVAVGLWPATAYGAALRRAFDALSPGPEGELEGLRGRALLFVAILPASVLAVLGLSWAGSRLLQDGPAGAALGAVVAIVFGLAGAFAFSLLIYRVFPPEPLPWRRTLWGALVSAAGTSLLALGLTLFVSLGADFESRYVSSAIAGLVLLGLWLFGSNAMLLIGYEVARGRPGRRHRPGRG